MTLRLFILLIITHLGVAGLGFAGGIYVLPILIAPPAPSDAQVQSLTEQAGFTTLFRRDLPGSDMLHWGEGRVSVGAETIGFLGKLAPGPDYKLYLSSEFVETKADFLRLKSSMLRIADIRTFDNFIVKLPANTDLTKYNSIIIWCESFEKFITAAKYR